MSNITPLEIIWPHLYSCLGLPSPRALDDGHKLGIISTEFGFARLLGFDEFSRAGLFGLVEVFIIDAKGFIQGINTSAMICVPEGGLKYL